MKYILKAKTKTYEFTNEQSAAAVLRELKKDMRYKNLRIEVQP